MGFSLGIVGLPNVGKSSLFYLLSSRGFAMIVLEEKKMETDENLSKITKFLEQQPDVILAYFYGSRAEGVSRENGDWDLAVLLDNKKSPAVSYGRGINLSAQLEKRLKSLSFDVRELNSASTFFCFQVLRKGRLLFSRDENQRAEFESRIRNKYFDLKSMYAEFYSDMAARLKEGKFGVRQAVAG